MKLHRFFVPAKSLFGRIIKIEDSEIAKLISKILRLKPDEHFMLLDGDGFEYVARLIKANSKEVHAEILKRQMNMHEPELKIALYQSLIKKDNFEWALQKSTEVGVSAFIPIISERVEKKDFNDERAKKIIKEAAEQSERGIIPELFEAQDFKKVLQRVCQMEAPTIILHPTGEPIKNYGKNKNLFALNIFVGPEGGFSDAEIDFARDIKKNGCDIEIINLGSRILRSETAGVVAAGIMLNR